MQFILVRETWPHMSSVSGFDALFAEFELRFKNNTLSFFANQFEQLPNQNRWQRLFKSKRMLANSLEKNSPFVEAKHDRLAVEVINAMQTYPNAIVLLSVTENQLSTLFNILSDDFKSRMVLFVHQPPAWFRLHWNNFPILNKVRAIIGLSEHQVNYFKSKSLSPVYMIHHGVDLKYFKPVEINARSNKKLVFVGQWMRDLNILNQSMQHLLMNNHDIELHCVIQRRFRNHPALYNLAQLNNVFWYDNIHSSELVSLYQQSDALYLPLIDSTANNAINEALACGLPIIASQVGGVKNYVLEEACLLADVGDVNDHIKKVGVFFEKIEEYRSKRLLIRQHAENNLSWIKQVDYLLSLPEFKN